MGSHALARAQYGRLRLADNAGAQIGGEIGGGGEIDGTLTAQRAEDGRRGCGAGAFRGAEQEPAGVEAAGEAKAKELDARRWWRVRKLAAAAEAVER
mgnify:CR=1 FL=1